MRMNNKTYDMIKRTALIVIPAIAVFYESIGLTWNIPYTSQIVITINAFSVFIGAIVEKASADYKQLQNDIKESAE